MVQKEIKVNDPIKVSKDLTLQVVDDQLLLSSKATGFIVVVDSSELSILISKLQKIQEDFTKKGFIL